MVKPLYAIPHSTLANPNAIPNRRHKSVTVADSAPYCMSSSPQRTHRRVICCWCSYAIYGNRRLGFGSVGGESVVDSGVSGSSASRASAKVSLIRRYKKIKKAIVYHQSFGAVIKNLIYKVCRYCTKSVFLAIWSYRRRAETLPS